MSLKCAFCLLYGVVAVTLLHTVSTVSELIILHSTPSAEEEWPLAKELSTCWLVTTLCCLLATIFLPAAKYTIANTLQLFDDVPPRQVEMVTNRTIILRKRMMWLYIATWVILTAVDVYTFSVVIFRVGEKVYHVSYNSGAMFKFVSLCVSLPIAIVVPIVIVSHLHPEPTSVQTNTAVVPQAAEPSPESPAIPIERPLDNDAATSRASAIPEKSLKRRQSRLNETTV